MQRHLLQLHSKRSQVIRAIPQQVTLGPSLERRGLEDDIWFTSASHPYEPNSERCRGLSIVTEWCLIFSECIEFTNMVAVTNDSSDIVSVLVVSVHLAW